MLIIIVYHSFKKIEVMVYYKKQLSIYMSELYKKVSLEEAKKFYDEIYLNFANDENTINHLSDTIKRNRLIDPLFKKQYEYKILLANFVEVINERKIKREDIIKTLNIGEELYIMAINSHHKGSLQSPVTLSSPQVYKMASYVLKDRIVKQLEHTKFEDKSSLLSNVFEEEKLKIKQIFENQLRLVQSENKEPVSTDKPANKTSHKP